MSINYHAILLEPFYEGLHYYYIKGLIELKDYHNALKYYDDLNERFYKELGTGLSPRFKELYDVITEDIEEDYIINTENVNEDLIINNADYRGFTVDMTCLSICMKFYLRMHFEIIRNIF